MFLIPILIIIAILGFTYSGAIVKDLHFGLPDFSLNLGTQTLTPQKKAVENKPSQYQQTSQSSSPRAPPPSLVKEKTVNSPYFQKIRISTFQATTESRPALITLRPNFSNETQIDITGWRIKSNWNGEFTVPMGVSKFHPIPLSYPTEHIIVKRDDTAYLRGESNPFGGAVNFRPNACFGYLAQYYQNLPESFSCSQDKPSIAEIKNLIPTCQEFILNKINYGACALPEYANVPGVGTNPECVSYITSSNGGFNYEGCYNKHANEQNFIYNRWYIYMNTLFGNSLHDSITLYDQNGLVVDTFIY